MLPRLLQPLQTTPLTSVGKYEARHGLVTHNMNYIPSSPSLAWGGMADGLPRKWSVQGLSLGTDWVLSSMPSV